MMLYFCSTVLFPVMGLNLLNCMFKCTLTFIVDTITITCTVFAMWHLLHFYSATNPTVEVFLLSYSFWLIEVSLNSSGSSNGISVRPSLCTDPCCYSAAPPCFCSSSSSPLEIGDQKDHQIAQAGGEYFEQVSQQSGYWSDLRPSA